MAFLITNLLNAQFGSKQLISETGGFEVFTFDLDGDGDQDVLEAGFYDISWYENVDGLGDFSSQLLISSQNDWDAVYAGDIDGDGDLDIVGVALMWQKPINISKVAWFENLDGLGNFGAEQLIDYDENFLILGGVITVDIDNDGDLDILSGSFSDISWYENMNGLGQFSERQIITTDVSRVTDLSVVDIDEDGDLDIISCSTHVNQLTWYENLDGLGNFGVQQIIATNIGEALSIYISDLNGDGYKDVLVATSESSEVSWFENTDGLGDFGQQQIIYSLEHRGNKVLARDIDNDGDMDVLSGSYDPPFGLGTIAWYENIDGQGTFGTQQIISQEENFGYTFFASDLDNDSDIDIVGASTAQVGWLENLTPLSINGNSKLDFSIYPNPVNDYLYFKNVSDNKKVSIYDISGRLIKSVKLSEVEKIDVCNLQSGTYILRVDNKESVVLIKE